jgi:hypothetical protein
MHGVALNGKIMEVVAIRSNSVEWFSTQRKMRSISLNIGRVLCDRDGSGNDKRKAE